MPPPRKAALFEMSGQWIAHISGTPILYRHWTDSGTGKSCRESLGTADLEEAKKIFASIVLVDAPKTPDSPLAAVFENYHREQTDHLASAKPARAAGRTFLQCWGDTVRASEVEARYDEFLKWSVVEKKHSLGYISRNLSVLAAALAKAKLTITVSYDQGVIRKRLAGLLKGSPVKVKARRNRFIPTDAQLKAYLATAMPEDLRIWSVMALLTLGRPNAVRRLTPGQRNPDLGLIDLNPIGRDQTGSRKYDALVRTTPALAAFLDALEFKMRMEAAKRERKEPRFVDISSQRYCAYTTEQSVKTAMQRVRVRAGLPLLSAYSFRHKGASIIKNSKNPKVSGEELAWQMGHKQPNLRTTSQYGEFDPDYLADAAQALENWWVALTPDQLANPQVIRKLKIIK